MDSLVKILELNDLNYKDEKVVIAKVNSAYNPKFSSKFMVRSVSLTVVISKDKGFFSKLFS